MFFIVLTIVVIILIVILAIFLKYLLTPIYQQALTFTIPLTNSYRFHPEFDGDQIRPLDAIKLSISSLDGQKKFIVAHRDMKAKIDHMLSNLNETIIVEQNEQLNPVLNSYSFKRASFQVPPTIENICSTLYYDYSIPFKELGLRINKVKVISGGASSKYERTY